MSEECNKFKDSLKDLVENKFTVEKQKALKLLIGKNQDMINKVATSTASNGANQPDNVKVVDKTKAPETVQAIGDDD